MATFQSRRCGLVSITILAAQVLAFGQATPQKATAPSTKKATPPAANPDTWQRNKECAAQADKVRDRKDGLLVDYEKSVRDLAASFSAAQALEAVVESAKSGKATPAIPITVEKAFVNHYSPKYGMCFLRAAYTLRNVGPGEHAQFDRTTAVLLINAFEGGLVADLDFSLCYVGGERADCSDTKNKIDDAMNN
jgi:hypothetical protein